MHATSERIRNIALLLLVSLFALFLALISLPLPLLVVLALGFVCLGLAVVVLTVRLKEAAMRKIFFLLAGTSAAAIPICVLLHNLVYALFILWFGEGYWEKQGTDEVLFFILATVVCPSLFLVGTVGSMVFLAIDFQDRWQRTGGHTGELR